MCVFVWEKRRFVDRSACFVEIASDRCRGLRGGLVGRGGGIRRRGVWFRRVAAGGQAEGEMRQIVEVFEQVQHRRLEVVGAFAGEVRVPPHEPAHHRQMRGEPLREERRAVVGRAQHHACRHRCRPPFGREGTRRCGSFFHRCAVDCGRSDGSSGRPVARGRPGRRSSVGRGSFFHRCAVDCGRSGGSNVGRGRRRGLHSGVGGSVR